MTAKPLHTLCQHLVLAVLAVTVLGGCSFYNETEQAEYDRVWAATSEVLGKYFNVKESQFIEGHLIAYSKISNQFGEQQRYKVDAWLDRDNEGFFHPRLQVLNQMNMSIVHPGKSSRAQVNQKWRSAGFNRKLETQLLNEIHERIGYASGMNADWFNTDLELIERQRKIDQARAAHRAREEGHGQPSGMHPGSAQPASGGAQPAMGGPQSHSTHGGN